MTRTLGACIAAFLVVVTVLGVEAQRTRALGVDVLTGSISQTHYQQFAGELKPAVDGTWKEEKILQLLAEHSPEVKSGEKRRQEAVAAGISPSAGLEFQDVVRLRRSGHEAYFLFDATTKFLERISLGFP